MYGEELTAGFEQLEKESLKQIKAIGDKLLTINDPALFAQEIENFSFKQYLAYSLSKVLKKALKELNLPLVEYLID